MTEKVIELTCGEDVANRSFAAIQNYESDIALLNYLLQDLRALMRRYAKSEITIEPYQQKNWHVHGLERRIVICDPDALVSSGDCLFVGFFGDRRQPGEANCVDAKQMIQVERQLIEAFPRYPGILSYSSTELVDHYWANLVVHRRPHDKQNWRHCAEHSSAVTELAPLAYHSVRIHNGKIKAGVCSTNTVKIEDTKYWDYDTKPVWTAYRRLI